MTAARALPHAAVLFDLDGTLIDSAPDLAGTGDDMRIARGLPPLGLAHFRPMVGTGARGMLARAFGIGPDDPAFSVLRDEFLNRYEQRMTRETHDLILAASLPILSVDRFGLSILSAMAMNAVLIVNHRPGRYIGY